MTKVRTMKKIVCLIANLGSGGAERQLCNLATLLSRDGYDVEVWCYQAENFYLPLLHEAGVKYRYIAEANDPKRRIWSIHKALKAAAPDTVIAYLDTPSIIACISKLLGGRYRLIVSERNTTQRLTLRERIKFWLYGAARYIVPNSVSQGEYIRTNHRRLASKLRVITNSLDTERFSPADSKCGDTFRLLGVGRVTPQKNLLRYIDAIAELRRRGLSIEVRWVGNQADREYMASCRERIAKHNLQDIFTFATPTADIVCEYRNATAFCLPSIYEGYPNVLCEAMSCGLPVACSRVCDNPYIAKEGVNGTLFDPYDINDIADGIARLYDMCSSSYDRITKENRQQIVANNSNEEFLARYKALIEA